MELFKKQTQIDFMAMRRFTTGGSFLCVLVALVILAFQGLNMGLEFTGGNQIELRFPEGIEIETVRQKLGLAQFHDVRVQHYGTTKEVLLRLGGGYKHAKAGRDSQALLSENILKVFNLPDTPKSKQVIIRRIEFVGSEVGAQLAEQGGMAVIVAILATMIYIALRFEYRLAVSAALALTHDAIVVLGILSLCQVEFDLATLAAVLAVMGYSLNDTIVVFDRVRENFRRIRKGSVNEIMNVSINQTLSRTIMTSLLTLLVVIALLLYGGQTLFGFSLALTLGIVIGTYSSIYVAGAMSVRLGLSRSDLMAKTRSQVDEMP